MKVIDGLVRLRAPEGHGWPSGACADLSIESNKGPSAAVYLTPGDCDELARRLGGKSNSNRFAPLLRAVQRAREEGFVDDGVVSVPGDAWAEICLLLDALEASGR